LWTATYEDGDIDSETLAEQLAEVEALIELVASIADMTDEEAKATPVFGGSAYYIRDLEALTFAERARDVAIPIFVMHGGRDFQTPVDPCFYLFQEIFAGRNNATLKLYDNLNHLFMPSTATSFTEHANEIMAGTGTVYAPALQDIVDWINGVN
jgi:dienelactone hydrolase